MAFMKPGTLVSRSFRYLTMRSGSLTATRAKYMMGAKRKSAMVGSSPHRNVESLSQVSTYLSWRMVASPAVAASCDAGTASLSASVAATSPGYSGNPTVSYTHLTLPTKA